MTSTIEQVDDLAAFEDTSGAELEVPEMRQAVQSPADVISVEPTAVEDDSEEVTDEGLTKNVLSGTDSISDYFTEIGRVSLLTAEQEVTLAKRIEAGVTAGRALQLWRLSPPEMNLAETKDWARLKPYTKTPSRREMLTRVEADGLAAKDHLVEANLRLVVSVAKRYIGKGLSDLDLYQEGNIGLIHAIELFDYTKGYKFSTYATNWIRKAVFVGLANHARAIRIPVHQAEAINKLSNAEGRLTNSYGRAPTPDELAKELDMKPEEVEEIRKYDHQVLSLETPVGGEDGNTLGDYIGEDVSLSDVTELHRLQDQLKDYINNLQNVSDRDKQIMRYMVDLYDNQQQAPLIIAEKIGMNAKRVSQIQRNMLQLLRADSQVQALQTEVA